MHFMGSEDGRLSSGSILGHFELDEIIGAGGMGLVYKARDLRLERTVAVKVLAPELFKNEKAKSRFTREARLAAAISHPNVATIHEIDEEGGFSFIAMELVRGSTLKDMLSSGPLPLPQVLAIGRQVCDALEAAHELGIIHRDIKSSNIMVTPSGQVKILDFGLAKAAPTSTTDLLIEPPETRRSEEYLILEDVETPAVRETSERFLLTNQGVALGTPCYMSPEQASGRPVNTSSDIFSLGVVLYEAASGELPFHGSSDRELLEAIQKREPMPIQATNRKVPRAFMDLLSLCLAKECRKRYASARLLNQDLSKLKKRLELRNKIIEPLLNRPAGRAGIAIMMSLLALIAL
jgi:serine/threonine protein kinase